MAYIQRRSTKDGQPRYRVQVRLRGHPVQTATFERKTDAKRWAQQVESAIREGQKVEYELVPGRNGKSSAENLVVVD